MLTLSINHKDNQIFSDNSKKFTGIFHHTRYGVLGYLRAYISPIYSQYRVIAYKHILTLNGVLEGLKRAITPTHPCQKKIERFIDQNQGLRGAKRHQLSGGLSIINKVTEKQIFSIAMGVL